MVNALFHPILGTSMFSRIESRISWLFFSIWLLIAPCALRYPLYYMPHINLHTTFPEDLWGVVFSSSHWLLVLFGLLTSICRILRALTLAWCHNIDVACVSDRFSIRQVQRWEHWPFLLLPDAAHCLARWWQLHPPHSPLLRRVPRHFVAVLLLRKDHRGSSGRLVRREDRKTEEGETTESRIEFRVVMRRRGKSYRRNISALLRLPPLVYDFWKSIAAIDFCSLSARTGSLSLSPYLEMALRH